MILGDVCTRNCAYCAVSHGRPPKYDVSEPSRVAQAVAELRLQHAVITSVDRDDLDDGGAEHFASTIREVRALSPDCAIEVLVPDFKDRPAALAVVMAERPEILNHNLETVPSLYRRVRAGADYRGSLALLREAAGWKDRYPVRTKSGIMVGLGEPWDDVLKLMDDLRASEVDIMTIGQYLRPSMQHLPVERYYTPDEFARLKEEGMARGFKHVESGPLVRSSYHAHEQTDGALDPVHPAAGATSSPEAGPISAGPGEGAPATRKLPVIQ
jgi:lipoic acid synthetase